MVAVGGSSVGGGFNVRDGVSVANGVDGAAVLVAACATTLARRVLVAITSLLGRSEL
jgi:hypothetical protein